MFNKRSQNIPLSSFFFPDNIKIFDSKESKDYLALELLENLGLTFGIGNVKQIYDSHFKLNSHPYILISEKVIVHHFRIKTIEKIRLSLAIIKNGIANKEDINSSGIQCILLIASPKNQPGIYLRLFNKLQMLFKEKDFITNLLTITDTQKVCDFIASTEMEIPPYILAKDIMKQVDVTLNENHTLADAVQYFINTGWLNIPVIDKDGDLVGEVTAQELMEVCLPRYVLWMDDLTPILNFEPFMNVLQNEEYTWLPEIMNMNIAKIQINDPAMKVAIEMVKKSVNHVYVLNDKKLAGIITLHTFLNKALRE